MMPDLSPHRGVIHLRAIFVSTLVLCSVALLLFATHTWRDTRHGLVVELDYVSRLLLQTTESMLDHHESMLRMLGERLRDVDALDDPRRARQLLDDSLALNAEIAGFSLSRPDGRAVVVAGLDPRRFVADRWASPAWDERGMVVGRTHYQPESGQWVIPVSVAMRHPDGRVLALVTAGIAVDSQAAMWNAIDVKPGMYLSLVRDDGHRQLALPAQATDRDAPYTAAFDEVASDYAPVDDTTSGWSHQIVRSERLDHYPLTLYARYEPEALFALFARRMALPLALFGMVLAIGALVFRYLLRSQQRFAENLIHHASHDALTALPNRVWLEDRIQQEILRARRNKRHLAVMYVDLDQFKRVNDTLGHKLGDQLLRACGQRLKAVLRKGDAVGRMGGDEFLMIFSDLADVGDARLLAARVLKQFDHPFDITGHELFSYASIGVAMYPDDGSDAGTLLQNADTALFRAKDEGRNSFRFFEPRLNKSTSRKIALEHALRSALARDELRVVYQPKTNAETLRWEGAEALLRWRSEKLGEVSPLEFIPVAEETGMIETLGWFVLHTALRDLHWIRAIVHDFDMAINVSLRQLRNPDFIPRLLERLRSSGVPPGLIELEVTESIMAESSEQFDLLRGAGLRLAIDDFGTGFSCLSYLKRLPVTTLKIDREFVRDLEVDSADKALITAMIAVARELDLATVAEGIENHGQLEFLRAQGCNQLQGFLLGRPMPIEQLLRELDSQQMRNHSG
jgi:diguanylate cyclase (GGDEF)-like protein